MAWHGSGMISGSTWTPEYHHGSPNLPRPKVRQTDLTFFPETYTNEQTVHENMLNTGKQSGTYKSQPKWTVTSPPVSKAQQRSGDSSRWGKGITQLGGGMSRDSHSVANREELPQNKNTGSQSESVEVRTQAGIREAWFECSTHMGPCTSSGVVRSTEIGVCPEYQVWFPLCHPTPQKLWGSWW